MEDNSTVLAMMVEGERSDNLSNFQADVQDVFLNPHMFDVTQVNCEKIF